MNDANAHDYPWLRKPKRWRSRTHRGFIAAQRCCVPGCFGHGIEVYHLKHGPENGNASDCWVVPICINHRIGKDSGGERAWAAKHGIDLVAIARRLQRESPVADVIRMFLEGQKT